MVTLEQIDKIKSAKVQEVIASPELASLLLLVYSTLWKCDPRGCSKSMRVYYRKVVTDGEFKLKNFKMKECKMKKGALIYSGKYKCHYSDHNITDKIARDLISISPKLKDMFEILPPEIDEVKEEIKEVKNFAISAKDAILAIKNCSKLEDLEAFKEDTRKSVVKEYQKKLKELN
jgi:hypothetical protein